MGVSASTLPEVPLLLERPPVDWERHRGDKRPKILPPPGVTWRNPTTGRKINYRYYTRVTTYADAITEAYNLMRWQLRRLALGLGQRADYVRLAAAYTDSEHDREALDELVGKALEAAGPNSADLGTALHALTERLDRGDDLGTPPEEVLPDLAAYTALTQGLIAYRHREARVVCDGLETAGTPDGHAHIAEPCPAGCGPEVLHIIDTKTGSIRYPGKMATQLAIYSRSDLYVPATGERIPVEVCQAWGAIIHLPAESGECAPFWLDLEHGWRGAELCGPVREWHRVKADDILRPFASVQPVRMVDGEVTRIEPRLASTNIKAPPAPAAGDVTELLAESLADLGVQLDDPDTVRDEQLDGEPDDEPELRVPEDVVDVTTVSGKIDPLGPYPVSLAQAMQPDGKVLAETRRPGRCPALLSNIDPGAPRCDYPAGHPGGHRFPAEVTPVERCVHELRLGECAMPSCRPDLAHLDDEGVERDDGPTEIPAEELAAQTVRDDVYAMRAAMNVTDEQRAELVEAAEDLGGMLAEQIRQCVTVRDVELLSSRRWREWSQGHRDLAVDRHDQLEAEERAAKPRAAFEAAVAAATSVQQLERIMVETSGQSWRDDACLDLASARWREIRETQR